MKTMNNVLVSPIDSDMDTICLILEDAGEWYSFCALDIVNFEEVLKKAPGADLIILTAETMHDLRILCQTLTMLKLNPETASTPVATFTGYQIENVPGEEFDDEQIQPIRTFPDS